MPQHDSPDVAAQFEHGGTPVGGGRIGRQGQLAEGLVDDEFEQLVLVRDVGVQRGGARPEPGAEFAHAQGVETLGIEECERFGHDLIPVQRRLLAA